MNPQVFTGLALGLVFGFVLQRGRFCMNSAFRDIIVMKEYTLFKAVMTAVLVQMVGFTLMAMAHIITLNPKPLMWGANITGGLIFGIGMVMAGGCASGITYRVGEGMVGAMSAVLGFMFAGLMTAQGVFKPIASFLQSNTTIKAADGSNLTLASILGIPYPYVAFGTAIIILIIWFFLSRGKKDEDDNDKDKTHVSLTDRIFKRGWGWLATGIAIGLIGMTAFPLSAATGRNYPLGITGGWIGFEKAAFNLDVFLSWEAMLVIGAVFGAMIGALISKEFAIRAPAPKVLLQTFAGGFLMAFGAVVSKGCNVGHILSGWPQLSLGSILGGICIVLGGWFMAYMMFIRPNR